jgi:hypothetical protein
MRMLALLLCSTILRRYAADVLDEIADGYRPGIREAKTAARRSRGAPELEAHYRIHAEAWESIVGTLESGARRLRGVS